MNILAPAKVNLYLEIRNKREDGFHEIETLFEKISLHDKLRIEISDTTKIETNDPSVPTVSGSLLSNIVEAFLEKTNLKTKFNVYLEKNIPIAAGLGGGSSDAAALLKGINILSGSPLNVEQMALIAGPLGSDIPFFLYEESFAIGKGLGTEIFPIETDMEIDHIIINPPLEASTKDIYNKVTPFNLTKETGADRMFSTFLGENDSDKIAVNLHNDLQIITLEKFPNLNNVLEALSETGAKGQIISGSGPTVFGIFDKNKTEEAMNLLKEKFKEEEGWRIFRAETYKESKEAACKSPK